MENQENIVDPGAVSGEVKTEDAQLATFDEIDKAIIDLKGRFDGRVYDVTTTAGMVDAKADRKEVKAIRTGIEKSRKEFKASVLERGRLIDSTAKKLTNAVREIEDPIDEKIKAEEQRIADAKAEHLRQVQEFIATCKFSLTEHHPVRHLRDKLEALEKIEIDKKVLKEATEIAANILSDSITDCKAALEVSQARKDAEDQRLAEQKVEDERLAAKRARLDKEKEDFRLEQEAEAVEAGKRAEAEGAERIRVDAIHTSIRKIEDASAELVGATSQTIGVFLENWKAKTTEDDLKSFQEFSALAEEAYKQASAKIQALLERTIDQEIQDSARLEESERLATQKAEQEQRDLDLKAREEKTEEPEPTAMRKCLAPEDDDAAKVVVDLVSFIQELIDDCGKYLEPGTPEDAGWLIGRIVGQLDCTQQRALFARADDIIARAQSSRFHDLRRQNSN